MIYHKEYEMPVFKKIIRPLEIITKNSILLLEGNIYAAD